MAGRGVKLTALSGLLLASAPLQAQPQPPLSTYLVTMSGTPSDEERLAPRGKPLADFTIQPDRGVILKGKLDPAIAMDMAVTAEFPFVEGRRLYGWRDHPGLYCDLMRNRGLGSSAACLRDSNADGVFDEAVRYDFNSASAQVVFITDKQKVRGGKFKGSVKLAAPLPYDPITDGDLPAAKLKLLWSSSADKRAIRTDAKRLEFILTDGNNFTGTEILASQYYASVWMGAPRTIEIYGVRVNLLGFDDKNGLRYRISPVRDKEPVSFGFRGYVMRFMYI